MNRQKERSSVMKAVTCLECDRRIHLSARSEVGDSITCPNCDSEYEIVGLKPVRIEWAYEGYDDYDEYEEFRE